MSKNKKEPLKVNVYRTIYSDVARLYSKKKCKWCYGRGILNIQHPDGKKHKDYCYCVKKEIDKNEG